MLTLTEPSLFTVLYLNNARCNSVLDVNFEKDTRTLALSNMNVINVGVCLQCEYQPNDVGNWQEGRHGVHQRPNNKEHTQLMRGKKYKRSSLLNYFRN